MRLRSFRIVGPVKAIQYSFFRSYHEAVDRIDSIPSLKEGTQFKALVVREWCTRINSLVCKFEFVVSERLLSAPLLVQGMDVVHGKIRYTGGGVV